ncbi:LuxR family transcriptional regulator [Arthrobacter sp. 24S4-2]|uniref:helix-turn-helix transcriptional regulator n=1 Tax=Arthrobacter sp. 24S4-2 TaxID=2575374 RepID=UPI0010C7BFB2|nr:LuxR C-terminal-related transcriptional regulator [Arthrobacter sp. 24S4-2]QCO97690.1 LuxR family transcriptional regulator [Arthrobacter sp. 24S4-2]
MTTSWAVSRSLERIALLCGSSLEDHELRAEVLSELGSIVPFTWFAWPLTDPETCTGVSPMARIPCPQELPALIRLKYVTSPGRWTSLLAGAEPAVTLQTATGGDPDRSPLWSGILRRYDVADVLSTVFADSHGCWGWLDLWRSADERLFTDLETKHLAAAAPIVAAGLRGSRAARMRRDSQPGREDQEHPDDSDHRLAHHRRLPASGLPQQAVLTLDAGLAITGRSASAADWLALLQPGPRPYEAVPAEVFNVAAQLLAREAGVDSHAASARVPIGLGQWAVLRSFRMDVGRGGEAPLAVTIQECPAAERLEVFARCFGLTPRQRSLLGLAAGGLDTAALAAALGISPYTVQDQFKAVFAACGVRSRNALLALALGTSASARRRENPSS